MPTKLSKEKLIDDVNNVLNDEYVLLDEFENNSDKVHVLHNKCNRISEYTINYIRKYKTNNKKYLCHFCGHEEHSLSKAKTQDEFEKELEEAYPGKYKCIGKYINNDTHIELLDLEKNIVFLRSPKVIIRNKSINKKDDFIKTHFIIRKNEFMQYFNQFEEYELLSEFNGINNDIVILHKKCGNIYTTKSCVFWDGHRCPKCSNSYSEEEAQKKINEKFDGKIIIEKYNGWKKISKFYCNKCENHYEAVPVHVFNTAYGGCECSKEGKGELSYGWKGGVTSIEEILRKEIWKWKWESSHIYDDKCIFTGDSDINIHHIFCNFKNIRDEVFEELDIDLSSNYLKDLSQSQIENIGKLMLKKHYEYGYGIPISKELHNEFHKIYGKYNNTLEQFLEFSKSKGIEFEKNIIEVYYD